MKNKKGFTLAELLIVVAIIAVLVGISIPVFTTQLEKAREATDLANARAIYAEVMHVAIAGETNSENGVSYANGIWQKSISLKQKKSGWDTKAPLTVGGITSGTDGKNNVENTWRGIPVANGQCSVLYNAYHDEAVISWNLDFNNVLTNVSATNQAYAGKTMKQLLDDTANFPMLDSSGGTGNNFSQEIKKAVGLSDSEHFAYLASKDTANNGVYYFYVSTERDLAGNNKNNKPGESTGNFISVIGYKYNLETNQLLEVGPEKLISTYYGKSGQEKMQVSEYSFH